MIGGCGRTAAHGSGLKRAGFGSDPAADHWRAAKAGGKTPSTRLSPLVVPDNTDCTSRQVGFSRAAARTTSRCAGGFCERIFAIVARLQTPGASAIVSQPSGAYREAQ
jgi:hypothetical protein